MVSQTKRKRRPRAQAHAGQREQRITLRFPPPLQPPAADGATTYDASLSVGHTKPSVQPVAAGSATAPQQHGDDDDDINNAWFTAGESSDSAPAAPLAPEPLARDSSARRLIPARPIALAYAPEGAAYPARRRRLLAFVSLILLSSVALIAIALFATREQRNTTGSAQTKPATPIVERVEAVRESHGSGRLESPPSAQVAIVPPPAVVPAPSPQQPAEERHLLPGAPQAARTSEVSSPRPAQRAARTRVQNTIARRESHFQAGVPLSQIYVNRDGDLVDAQGKPLDWKSSSTTAPNPVGATSAREATIRDAGE